MTSSRSTIPERTINLAVSDDVLAERRAAMEAKGWQPAKPRDRRVSPALEAYAAMTTSAARGAIRDVSQIKRAEACPPGARVAAAKTWPSTVH